MSETSRAVLDEIPIDYSKVTVTIIQMCYGIPSFCIMVFCFVLIWKNRTVYKNSFYFLVRFDLFTNMLVWLNTWIAIRFDINPATVFIPATVEYLFPGSLNVFKYMSYFYFHLHFYTAALLTLHRLSSVLYPTNYELFWSSWLVRIILIGILCVLSHVPRFYWNGNLYDAFLENGKLVVVTYEEALKDSYDLCGVFSVVYFCLNFGAGLYTALQVNVKFANMSANKNQVTRKLTKIAYAYCCAYLLEVSWSIFNSANTRFQWFGSSFQTVNNIALTFASDLFTLSLPFILLKFDSNIRRSLLHRKNTSATGTLAIISN